MSKFNQLYSDIVNEAGFLSNIKHGLQKAGVMNQDAEYNRREHAAAEDRALRNKADREMQSAQADNPLMDMKSKIDAIRGSIDELAQQFHTLPIWPAIHRDFNNILRNYEQKYSKK